MIDYYNNETRLTEILRAVVDSSEIHLGPARTREEIFVSRAFGLTMWPAIPPRTTMEMWLAFIAGDAAEPAPGSYTVRTCAESCIITYARRVRGASAVVPIFPPHTHYERALAKLAGIVPVDWGVMGREWEHLMQTLAVSTMPRSAVAVIGGERVSVGPGGEITPYQNLHGYGRPWAGGTGKNLSNMGNATTTSGGALNRAHNGEIARLQAGQTYTLTFDVIEQTVSGAPAGSRLGVYVNDTTAIWRVDLGFTGKITVPYTPQSDCYINFWSGTIWPANTKVIDHVQVELGSTATAFEPYENICSIYPGLTLVRDNGTKIVAWGGELNSESGVLTVTDAEIASYAGETLPGEWISDRDAYAAGAVPTTGAQVVYKLAESVTYQLTRAEVQRTLTCAEYLGVGVWRLSCGGATIIHAQIHTNSPVNHYDIAASAEGWSFEITVDGVKASGGSGTISVPAGDHDVVIAATPGAGAGVCIIQPTLYYTAMAGLLGARQDLKPEPEDPERPDDPVEPETTKRRRAK